MSRVDLKYEEFLPSLMRKCWDEHRRTHRDTIEDELALIPFSSSYFGAVLFADISGFTRLSSSLSAEELKRYINTYFSTVIGVIESYNGDVIKFCGDALLVVWPVAVDAPPKVQETAVVLACKCALNLVNKSVAPPSDQLGESKQKHSFRFHCGVSCGIVHGYVMGTTARLEFLISGNPVGQAGDAAAEASTGEVCVSPDAISRAQSRFESVPMPQGNFLLTDMIFCHPGCFRCANLSGLYRLKGGGRATGTATPIPTIDGTRFSTACTPISGTPKEGSRCGSPREGYSSVDSPQRTVITEDVVSALFNADKELDKSAFPPLTRKRSRGARSLFERITDSYKNKSFGQSGSSRVYPTEPALALNNESSDSPDTEEFVKAYHLEAQRTEAAVFDFLRPYALTSLSKKGITPAMRPIEIEDEAAELFYGLFVGRMVRVALESDMVEFIAEIKPVTTMFIDIIGADDDFKIGACERPQKAISCIVKALERCGGFLRQYLVDDKGCVAICGFGVPGYSHNDDCTRAIEAAVMISRGIRRGHMNCRIGIALGKVYCGLVGSAYRCEYAMMGASVNLAARLMGKCVPGQILVSEDVKLACAEQFQFEAKAAVKAKGFKLPIQVFAPMGRFTENPMKAKFSVNQRNVNFVGREDELKKLNAVFGEFCSMASGPAGSKIRALFVEGPSGIGKTSVMAEMCHRASLKNVPTYSAVSVPPSSVRGIGEYDTMAQLLSQVFFNMVEDFVFTTTEGAAEQSNTEGGPSPVRSLSWEPMSGGFPMSRASSQTSHLEMLSPRSGRSPPTRNNRSPFQPDGSEEKTCDDQANIQAWFSIFCTESDTITAKLTAHNTSKITHANTVIERSRLSTMAEDNERESSDEDDPDLRDAMNRATKCMYSHSHSSSIDPDVTEAGLLRIAVLDALSLLTDIMPVQFGSNAILGLVSSGVRDSLREALVLFIIRRCCEVQPAMIVVNALHWCDASSLRVILKILKSGPKNCFFMCGVDSNTQTPTRALSTCSEVSGSIGDTAFSTYDNGDCAGDKNIITKIRNLCVTYTLEPFDFEDTAELIRKQLGDDFLAENPDFISRSTVERLLSRTEGVPGLLVTLISMLKDNGIEDENTFEQNILPLGDYASINFDILNPTEKFVLKLCSVIGMYFCGEDTKALTERVQTSSHSIDIAGCLEGLADKGFLTKLASSHSGDSESVCDLQYQFVSSYLHESVYNIMLQHQKSKAHGVYAGLLESRGRCTTEELNLIIDHYMRSNDNSKKFEFLRLGLDSLRGTNDDLLLFSYLTRIIAVWTKGSVADIIKYCCAPLADAVATTNDVDPRAAFASMKQRHRRNLPTYVGFQTIWLYPSIFQNSYPTVRGQSDWLPCWLAERSAILFSRGVLREAHNEALLALHLWGLSKHCLIVPDDDAVGEVLTAHHLNNFSPRALFALGAILVELAAVHMMFNRRTECMHFMRMSDVVHKKISDEQEWRQDDCTHCFYLQSLHNFKKQLRRIGITNKGERLRMLQSGSEKVKDILASRSSSSFDDVPSLAGTVSSLNSVAFVPMRNSVSAASSPMSSSNTVNTVIQSRVAQQATSVAVADAAMNPFSSGGEVVRSKSALLAVQDDMQDATLPELLVCMSEGKFAATSAALGLLKTRNSNQPFLYILAKYSYLLSAWCAFLSGETRRSSALAEYLQEFSLAYNQTVLYRWSSQLRMLHIIFGEYEDCESLTDALTNSAAHIRNVTADDSTSACTSACIAFATIVQCDGSCKCSCSKKALPLARYAIEKLSSRSAVTLVSGVYLFIAGYAAALIMQHDNVTLNCLSGSAAKKHRDISPRLFKNCQPLVEKALEALERISSPNIQPCLILLYDALALKFFCACRTLGETKLDCKSDIVSRVRLVSSMKSNLPQKIGYRYEEFNFGLAFLQLEQLHFIKANIEPSSGSPISLRLLELEVFQSFSKVRCVPKFFTKFPGPDSVLSYLITKDVALLGSKQPLRLLAHQSADEDSISILAQIPR